MKTPTVAASIKPGQSAGAIRPGDVHAWVVGLDGPAAESCSVLDGAERQRAQRYLSPWDGARFAASRAGLRLILGSYLGTEPASLRFTSGRDGRPALADVGGSPVGLDFSLARTRDLALVAVSGGDVGADIERIMPREGLADLVGSFGEREAACIRGGCGGSPLRAFYRHWTAKEAYLKALGCGLDGIRQAELCCDHASPVIWFCGRPADGWTLSLLSISPGHAAAVVAREPVTGCWRLER